MTPAPAITHLLRWTEASGGQSVGDPLGLELRVEARLLSQLLYCITSVTPRARYYGFLVWCVQEYQRSSKSRSAKGSLRDWIRAREKALVLGCIAHHEGDTCDGMSVVGSNPAKALYTRKNGEQVDLSKFRGDPRNSMAWNQYFGSLQNLGLFKFTEPNWADEAEEGVEAPTEDDLELSEVGERLASAYGESVSQLGVTTALREGRLKVSWSSLASFGARGGVCEIMEGSPADREVLRGLFLETLVPVSDGSRSPSHSFRRRSLLLLMHLAGQMASAKVPLTERAFADAVYYGTLVIEERVVPVGVPDALADIAARWRMFYMHYYAAMGLEAAFKGITGLADGAGLRGVEFTEVLEALGTVAATKRLAKHLGVALPKSMLDLSWMELARAAGVNLEVLDGSGVLDSAAGGTWRLAERRLTDLVGRRSKAGYPEILATGIVLLTTTLARLRRWEETPYGTWLAGASDNVRDVTPAVVSTWLRQRYQRWWTIPIRTFLADLLKRFVVEQHEWLGYQKGHGSSKIILHEENGRLTATDRFDRLGVGNPRFGNAVQVLVDLRLLGDDDSGLTRLTRDGKAWLERELAAEDDA